MVARAPTGSRVRRPPAASVVAAPPRLDSSGLGVAAEDGRRSYEPARISSTRLEEEALRDAVVVTREAMVVDSLAKLV